MTEREAEAYMRQGESAKDEAARVCEDRRSHSVVAYLKL
jgi:hypothetical protein